MLPPQQSVGGNTSAWSRATFWSWLQIWSWFPQEPTQTRSWCNIPHFTSKQNQLNMEVNFVEKKEKKKWFVQAFWEIKCVQVDFKADSHHGQTGYFSESKKKNNKIKWVKKTLRRKEVNHFSAGLPAFIQNTTKLEWIQAEVIGSCKRTYMHPHKSSLTPINCESGLI